MSRLKGTISRLVEPGGYGFIKSDDKPYTKIFFHFSYLPTSINFTELKTGMEVTFEISKYIDKEGNDKGWRATEIQVDQQL